MPTNVSRTPSWLPAGSVRVRIFYTGMLPQTAPVNVSAGQRIRHDVSMQAANDAKIVKLAEFVVGTTREMDGAALAINEQRFASNIMNVISSDEFGGVAEGNVAEVMKFLPGVTIENSGGNLRFIRQHSLL